MTASAMDQNRPRTVAAFDLPLRLFHWSLVLLVLVAWASFEFSEALRDPVLKYHRWAGLAILTLLVWRVMWGFAGPRSARFSSFVRGPGQIASYGRDLLAGREAKYLGHNPLGSLMILALIGLLLVQAGLGLFAEEHNELTAGPLYFYLSEAGRKAATSWHGFLFENVLLVLIGLHIAANIFYVLAKGEPLIKAMVTGRKPVRDYADADVEADVENGGIMKALGLLILSGALVYGALWAAGGKFLRMSLF